MVVFEQRARATITNPSRYSARGNAADFNLSSDHRECAGKTRVLGFTEYMQQECFSDFWNFKYWMAFQPQYKITRTKVYIFELNTQLKRPRTGSVTRAMFPLQIAASCRWDQWQNSISPDKKTFSHTYRVIRLL